MRDRRLDLEQVGGAGHAGQYRRVHRDTARAIESVGGAKRGKALIILNPAEPPMIMRDTVFTLSQGASRTRSRTRSAGWWDEVRSYVPGYRLKQKVQFERIGHNNPVRIPAWGRSRA